MLLILPLSRRSPRCNGAKGGEDSGEAERVLAFVVNALDGMLLPLLLVTSPTPLPPSGPKLGVISALTQPLTLALTLPLTLVLGKTLLPL